MYLTRQTIKCTCLFNRAIYCLVCALTRINYCASVRARAYQRAIYKHWPVSALLIDSWHQLQVRPVVTLYLHCDLINCPHTSVIYFCSIWADVRVIVCRQDGLQLSHNMAVTSFTHHVEKCMDSAIVDGEGPRLSTFWQRQRQTFIETMAAKKLDW